MVAHTHSEKMLKAMSPEEREAFLEKERLERVRIPILSIYVFLLFVMLSVFSLSLCKFLSPSLFLSLSLLYLCLPRLYGCLIRHAGGGRAQAARGGGTHPA